MKKVLITLLAITLGCFLFSGSAFAADKTETLTFGWEYADTTNLDHWTLYWSDTAGGPYTEVVVIPYDASGATSYTHDEQLTITADQGANVTKYFVMTASSTDETSADSNEVSYDFHIPMGTVFNLQVTVKTTGQ